MSNAAQRILLLLALVLSACSLESPGSGSANLRVVSQSVTLADITRVSVEVSGAGISPDISVELSDDGSGWAGSVGDIPAGSDRTFQARAFDESDEVIYSGEAVGIEIVAGESVTLVLVLQQETPNDPFTNAAPAILALVADKTSAEPGEDVAFSVTATDPDGDPITIEWEAEAGSFDDPSAAAPTWTAPQSEGNYELTVRASDDKQATSSVARDFAVALTGGAAVFDVETNSSPIVESITVSDGQLLEGESTQLLAASSDPDGDTTTVLWSAACGDSSFDDETSVAPTLTLQSAPLPGEECSVSVEVSDGRGGTGTGTVALTVGPEIVLECDDPDSDGDGVCDSDDSCAGYDDSIDTDGDGIPDGCDDPMDPTEPIVVDTTATGAVVDGIIGPSEYVGSLSGNGSASLGGLLGNGILYLDSDQSGKLFLGFEMGIPLAADEFFVVYVDTEPGGAINNETFTDIGDAGRTAVSGYGAPINFPSGFEADFALVLNQLGAVLYALTPNGAHIFLSLPTAVFGGSAEVELDLLQLGSSNGQSISFIVTYLSVPTPGFSFRSNEALPGGNILGLDSPGFSAVTFTEYTQFTSVAAP